MEDYSLALALFDYLPVAASALGFYWLANLIGNTAPSLKKPALLAAVLIVGGGLCKACWKLIWVLGGNDLGVLANLLFILMAPGMVLLALCCHSAQQQWNQRPARLYVAGRAALVIAVVYTLAAVAKYTGPESRSWFFLLLATASLANISISVMLIRHTWRRPHRATALIFLASMVLILCLSGLARVSAGSAPLQWVAEIMNLTAQSLFAVAVWRLRRIVIPKPSPSPSPSPSV